ncbi:MAG: sulfotransferase family protein [Pirellulaceae bacterium]
MRSGSTLLKALLAEAIDISNLPEVNFQSPRRIERAKKRAGQKGKSIVVLKRPAWYHEANSYPQLPQLTGLRTILLVRDVYPTVMSLRKMTFGPLAGLIGRLGNRWMVEKYWARVTSNLLELEKTLGDSAICVRYEDLVSNPVETTTQLFRFLNSRQSEGVASYRKPSDYRWRWGRDDAGANIKTLQVQPPRQVQWSDSSLSSTIQECELAMRVRQTLDYPPLARPAE